MSKSVGESNKRGSAHGCLPAHEWVRYRWASWPLDSCEDDDAASAVRPSDLIEVQCAENGPDLMHLPSHRHRPWQN